MLSNGGGLPSNPLHAGPKQIQVRRVAVAEPQTKFGWGAEQQRMAQGESHFLYEWQERDSDLRAPCRSSDSGGLPPSRFQVGPKQIQARRVVAAEPQAEFPGLCFGAAYPPKNRDESHFLYEWQESDSDLPSPFRSSGSGGLPPIPFESGPNRNERGHM